MYYVKELCIKKGIKPVFTNNKLTILSNGILNGIPVLRIHKIFAACSGETAEAVVNYYFDIENRGNHIALIQNYASHYLRPGDYKIAPLSDKFMTSFMINNHYGGRNINLDSVLSERSISSITQKSDENDSIEILDGTIKVPDDHIAELDIVIDL